MSFSFFDIVIEPRNTVSAYAPVYLPPDQVEISQLAKEVSHVWDEDKLVKGRPELIIGSSKRPQLGWLISHLAIRGQYCRQQINNVETIDSLLGRKIGPLGKQVENWGPAYRAYGDNIIPRILLINPIVAELVGYYPGTFVMPQFGDFFLP